MSENNESNGNGSKIFIIIIIAALILLALWFIFFRDNNKDNTPATPNIYQSANQVGNAVGDTVNIVDENAKALYNRVKNGITLNGKLIEVPASYMKKITDKVSAAGYKMTDDTRRVIDAKLDDIESTLRNEGKSDIKDLSKESQDKIKNIASEIEKML